VGKNEESRNLLHAELAPIANIASGCVKKYRPKIAQLTDQLDDFPFGSFHLFMCGQGSSKFHRDPNDYLSFLFPIQVEEGKKGALELGGLDAAFKWKVGDAILLDSRLVEHGIRDYEGNPENRWIGIFLLQHPFLKAKGLKKEEIFSDGQRMNLD